VKAQDKLIANGYDPTTSLDRLATTGPNRPKANDEKPITGLVNLVIARKFTFLLQLVSRSGHALTPALLASLFSPSYVAYSMISTRVLGVDKPAPPMINIDEM